MGVALIEPEGWGRGRGYAHGVVGEGRAVFVAGQIGWDPRALRLVDGGFAAQAGQALANVAEVLRAGGAGAADLVRMTWYVTDRQAYLDAAAEVGVAYRALFGRHYPAMSVVVVAGLLEAGALVEIEATALVAGA